MPNQRLRYQRSQCERSRSLLEYVARWTCSPSCRSRIIQLLGQWGGIHHRWATGAENATNLQNETWQPCRRWILDRWWRWHTTPFATPQHSHRRLGQHHRGSSHIGCYKLLKWPIASHRCYNVADHTAPRIVEPHTMLPSAAVSSMVVHSAHLSQMAGHHISVARVIEFEHTHITSRSRLFADQQLE